MIRRHDLFRAVALTAFLFGLFVWLYVVVVQVTHPDWMDAPFSHLPFFPFSWRLDNTGMTAFAIAAVGFLIWQIELNIKSTDHVHYCRECGSIIDEPQARFCNKCGTERPST